MKLALFSVAIGLASASPHYGDADITHWMAPGDSDFRGPCPMMNTLANHNFLPHDGRNITRDKLIDGLGKALNFDAELASLMFDMATVANPMENATWFTLDQLNRHNVLEHDASLSRTDAYFGNNHIFNKTVFAETTSYWTTPILTTTMLANSKLARQITSRAFNPEYKFTETTEQFSLGEVAAPIIAFGNMQEGTVDRDLVEYFFHNERFPTDLGWKTRSEVVDIPTIGMVSTMVGNATSLLTGEKAAAAKVARDLHAGFRHN
ncbi:Chloroperoxidase [Aspergillus unguis]